MRGAWIAVFVVAMGCGAAKPPLPPHIWVTRSAQRLASGDVATIRTLLRGAIESGGLWFDDATCRDRFGRARTIPVAEDDDFARCLAGLHLVPDTRRHELPDFALYTYAPGIEIETRFYEGVNGRQLVWIGYVGSADGKPTLPTVTPQMLESLRTAGEPSGIEPQARPAIDEAIAQTHGMVVAWFKVCLDRNGALTGVHPIAGHTKLYEAALDDWAFQPVLLGGKATPACAWIEVGRPPDGAIPPHVSLLPVAPLDPSIEVDHAGDDPPLVGKPTTHPAMSERDRNIILSARVDTEIITSARWCVDVLGHVTMAATYTSSGYPDFDRKLVKRSLEMTFRPGGPAFCTFEVMILQYRSVDPDGLEEARARALDR